VAWRPYRDISGCIFHELKVVTVVMAAARDGELGGLQR
jgi:hypothetical protein